MFRRHEPVRPAGHATFVRRRFSLDVSVTGFVYIAMMLFMGLAAINSQANLLFGVFGLMIGTLLVSAFISRLVLRRVAVRRVLPEHACVGHPVTFTYQITNGKRFWPSLSVVVAELDGVEGFTRQPQAYMLHAAPQVTASVPCEVIPKRRGIQSLNRYQLGTSFPFGFIKRAVTARHRDVLLVYPPLAEVDRKLLSLCRSAEIVGEMTRPRAGGGDEFYGVKEYRVGDNPRLIYWRRSARPGALVSKEMTHDAPPRILLLVDTHLPEPAAERQAAVERCIAMAASLAAVALDNGVSVGLCAWANGWVAIAPTGGKRHREELLSVLSRLPLNAAHELAELVERARPVLHTGTTPVLFSPRQASAIPLNGARRGGIVLHPDSPQAAAWFRFDPGINFSTCMPADQQMAGSGRRVHGPASEESAAELPHIESEARHPEVGVPSLTPAPSPLTPDP